MTSVVLNAFVQLLVEVLHSLLFAAHHRIAWGQRVLLCADPLDDLFLALLGCVTHALHHLLQSEVYYSCVHIVHLVTKMSKCIVLLELHEVDTFFLLENMAI